MTRIQYIVLRKILVVVTIVLVIVALFSSDDWDIYGISGLFTFAIAGSCSDYVNKRDETDFSGTWNKEKESIYERN